MKIRLFSLFFAVIPRREFGLELKRRDRAQVLTEIVELIALPFPFPSKLKIWSLHVLVIQGRQRNVQKSVKHVQSCCFAHKTYCFFDVPLCRCRRSFVRSLIYITIRRGSYRSSVIFLDYPFKAHTAPRRRH